MRTKLFPALTLVLATVTAQAFPIVANVVETGGDNEQTDTITAKWTGVTWNTTQANEPIPATPVGTPYTVGVFTNHSPLFVDRNHRWTNASATIPLPPYLAGQEYIMSGNDNRDNPGYLLDVSVATPVLVYMLIDNRLGDPNSSNADPPSFGPTRMQWILDENWLPVTNGMNRAGAFDRPDEVAVDEGADGTINQWSSVYVKYYPAGTFQLRQADNTGQNMYGVVIASAVPPGTPTNLTAVAGDSRVSLSWSTVAGAGGYVVRRAFFAGGPYEAVATNSTTTYVDTGLANDTPYYYVVTAFNLAGEGPNSPEATATPRAAPANVTATGGQGQIVIGWDAFPGAASYTISRSSVAGGPYTAIATGVTGTSHADTTIQGGQTYYYVVTAQLMAGGSSGQSSEVSGFASPTPPTLTAARWAATANQLTWTSSNAVVNSYWVERSTDGLNFLILTNIPATPRMFVDVDLAPSTTYFYRIQAENASGQSEFSNVASNTTPAFGLNINFANALNGTPANNPAPIPPGYAQDIGEIFGPKTNGLTYGWDRDITVDSRYRNSPNSPDLRYDTFNHLQKLLPSAIWEIELPVGFYSMRIVSGDPTAVDSTFQMNVEGVDGPSYVPVAGTWWADTTIEAGVGDGRLTINSGPRAANNKINFIDIYPAVPKPPMIGAQPAGGATEEFHPLNLSVAMSQGSQPFVYQWYLDGIAITDATNATYAVPRARATDAGAYSVIITNWGGAVTSAVANVTVPPDTTAPQMVAMASVDGKTIGVCFSEPLENSAGQMTDYFNYSINNSAVFAQSITLRPDGRSVILHLASPITGEFTVGVNTVNPTHADYAGNPVPPTTLTNRVTDWFAGDVGGPALLGQHYTCDLSEFEVVGGGADIWGASDQFYLISRPVTGNFDARVRVTGLTGSNAITKAVLVARESTNGNDRAYHISVNPTPPGRNQIELGLRSTLGGATASWGAVQTNANIPNVWMRITRVGQTFTGYRSVDGATWIPMGTNTLAVAMPATMAIGIGVTAHDNSLLATGMFSNFTISQAAAPPRIVNMSYSGGRFNLGFATEGGATYRVEYKNDLNDPTWTTLTTVTGDGNPAAINDPSATVPRRFYRIRVE